MKVKTFLERAVSHWPAKVLSVAAAIMLFLFHSFSTLSERYMNVPLKIVYADGFTAGQPVPSRVRVVVRGKEKNIAALTEGDIRATVDFSAFTMAGTYRAPIQIRKEAGAKDPNIMEFRVEPIELQIPIEGKVRERLEVIPTFKGTPLPGYELSHFFISPSLITVDGPESKMDRAHNIQTEEINLSGRKEDFTLSVRLSRNDPLIVFPEGDVVEFRGFVQETVILKTFESVSIVALDLRPDLRFSQILPKGSIRVQGGQNDIENIQADQVRLVVDGKAITGSGTFTLPVKTDVPSGLLVLRYEPTSITVNVEQGE